MKDGEIARAEGRRKNDKAQQKMKKPQVVIRQMRR
jgi:hypothetical protein